MSSSTSIYLKEYFKDFDEKKESKDPRSKSLSLIKTIESKGCQSFSAFSRIFNDFPLEIKSSEGKYHPCDAKQMAQLLENYNSLLHQEIHFDDIANKIVCDKKTHSSIQTFAGQLVALSCQELLDETGNLKPIIAETMGLTSLLETYKNEKEFIYYQLLSGFYSQLIYAALQNAWQQQYFKSYNGEPDKMGRVTHLVQQCLQTKIEEGHFGPTAFFSGRIREHIFLTSSYVKNCAHALQDLTEWQLCCFVLDDIGLADKQFTKGMYAFKIHFWENVCNYLMATTNKLAPALQALLKSDSEPDFRPSLSKKQTAILAEQIRIRDNYFFIDHICQSIGFELTDNDKIALKELMAARESRDAMLLPIEILILTALDKCDPDGKLHILLDAFKKIFELPKIAAHEFGLFQLPKISPKKPTPFLYKSIDNGAF